MNDRVFKLDEFKGGRVLGYTEAGGKFQVMTKDGGNAVIVDITYPPGALTLLDDRGVIVEPFTYEGALDLAERVLDGDQKALTNPRTILALASAVVGFSFPPEAFEQPAVALIPEVAHHVV